MAIDIFVNFKGNCREAVEFYAEVFKTEKPQIMTYGDTPQQPGEEFPQFEEVKNMVMAASVNINGSNVMFQDVFPDMPLTIGSNINLTITLNDMEEIKSIFSKLKEGGAVSMDLQETFWSKLYGAVIDKFGIPWQFNYMES
ncbi:VOC family protein [Clostridium sp.]|uniref:VOC family protein n=1 Tax=Clostridium sp. TaxID=1506 RepID=UPI002FC67184